MTDILTLLTSLISLTTIGLIVGLYLYNKAFFNKDRLMLITIIGASLTAIGAVILTATPLLVFDVIGITASVFNLASIVMLKKTL